MNTGRIAGRTTERGAAMVEAIVVISLMIVFYVGINYFHGIYEQALVSQQLSRSASIAYGMVGCPAGEPATWGLQTDVSGFAPQWGDYARRTNVTLADNRDLGSIAIGDDKNQPITNALNAMGLTGGTLDMVRTTGKSKTTASGRLGFSGKAVSTSYSSCSDFPQVGIGDPDQIVNFIPGAY
jgi:hypothetical protein